jgi:hypothetical protein
VLAEHDQFDDAPQDRGLNWTANQYADALRSPLAAIGVRVVRQRGSGATSPRAGFQARGLTRGQYDTKLNTVDTIVDNVAEVAEEELAEGSGRRITRLSSRAETGTDDAKDWSKMTQGPMFGSSSETTSGNDF